MSKVFNKDLFGTKVAVVVGRDKAFRLSELIEKHLGYSERAEDIKTSIGKFDGGAYAISLETGKYGKVDLYKKKGFKIFKWNDCLIDKVEGGHQIVANDTPISGKPLYATAKSPSVAPVVKVEKSDVNANVGVTVVFNGVDPQGLVRPTNDGNKETTTNKIDGGNIMKNTNKTLGGNMMERLVGKFGMVSTDDVRLTMTGALAFFDKKRDRWLSLGNGQLIDNLDMVMDFEGAFAMPVKKSDLKVGDMIITPAGNYSFLESVDPLKVMTKTGSISTIKEIGNIFGMDAFFTVIRPIFGGAVDGLNPMMFMAMKKDGGSNDKLSKMLMLQAMSGNGGLDMSNPMVTMLLLGDDKKGGDMKDLLMLQAMSGGKGLDFNNPMVMMSVLGKDGDFDMKDMLMFQAMNGANGGTAQAGGFNPMMLMAMKDKKGGKMDMKEMFMLQAMTGANGGNAGAGFDMSNPMTMMMLAGDGDLDMKDMMMFQAMAGANKPVARTNVVPSDSTPATDGTTDTTK